MVVGTSNEWRELREMHRVSQSVWGLWLGVSQKTVSRWEDDDHPARPSDAQIVKMGEFPGYTDPFTEMINRLTTLEANQVATHSVLQEVLAAIQPLARLLAAMMQRQVDDLRGDASPPSQATGDGPQA